MKIIFFVSCRGCVFLCLPYVYVFLYLRAVLSCSGETQQKFHLDPRFYISLSLLSTFHLILSPLYSTCVPLPCPRVCGNVNTEILPRFSIPETHLGRKRHRIFAIPDFCWQNRACLWLRPALWGRDSPASPPSLILVHEYISELVAIIRSEAHT